MRITLNITAPSHADADLLSLEIPADTTLSTLKESVQAESRIPKTSQHLYHNGHLLADDSKTMQELQISDGDMLALHVREQRQPPRRQAGNQNPSQGDPEILRLRILGDPASRANLARSHPELARVLENPVAFAQALENQNRQEQAHQAAIAREIAALNDDPFDANAQAKIEEMIREERVQENLQNAIEHNPEVFGRVHMLYIDVEVNGHKVKAFVDSGAQATIMSPSCAETCGIMRLVDKRYAGIARGVGTAAILGRVHSAQIKIGNMHLPCSFTVMEGKDVDLLLGLDMLKRHQACIDLSKDMLVIQGMEIPFLGEADIPKGMEEERAEEPQVAGPGGTTIGGRSGVVSAPAAGSAPSSSRPAAQASAPAAPVPAPAQPTFSLQDINQIVSLGFPREQAIQALAACDGNVEYAIGLLLG